MSNAYKQFLKLIPRDHLQAGTVTAHNADGTSDVELPGGQTVRVRGQDVAVASNAFIKGGEIVGSAPDLPIFNITV